MGCDPLLSEGIPPQDGLGWQQGQTEEGAPSHSMPQVRPSLSRSKHVSLGRAEGFRVVCGSREQQSSEEGVLLGVRRALCLGVDGMESGLVQAQAPGRSWAVNWDLGGAAPVCVESHWTP